MVKPEENEEAYVNEEQFQRDLLHAKMISMLQTTLPEREPSNRAKVDMEDGIFEDELIDYEPSPSHTQIVLASDFEEENEEDVVSGLVVGLEAVGGEKEVPTKPRNV